MYVTENQKSLGKCRNTRVVLRKKIKMEKITNINCFPLNPFHLSNQKVVCKLKKLGSKL